MYERERGGVEMLIFGIIGVIGVVNAFILWCCCKVGKESDIHLEMLLRDKPEMRQERIEGEDE